jgi:hypothetical protein
LLTQKGVRETLIKTISARTKISEKEMYVDIPTAPSLPVTSKRESLDELCVFSKSSKGKRVWMMSFQENVVLNAIRGYVDMFRVYTSAEDREGVEKATNDFFGSNQDFTSKLSV